MSQHANTYWNENGKYQAAADAMGKLVPRQGDCTKGSLLELFRLAANAYYDLFNNGLGNAQVRLPELIDALADLERRGYFEKASSDFRMAVVDIQNFNTEFLEAEEGSGWDGDEEEDEYCEGSAYPATGVMYGALETLLDFILELYGQGVDVHDPLPQAEKAA